MAAAAAAVAVIVLEKQRTVFMSIFSCMSYVIRSILHLRNSTEIKGGIFDHAQRLRRHISRQAVQLGRDTLYHREMFAIAAGQEGSAVNLLVMPHVIHFPFPVLRCLRCHNVLYTLTCSGRAVLLLYKLHTGSRFPEIT